MAQELEAAARAELAKGLGDALLGRSLVPGEEVVDVDDGAFLQQRLDEAEHRNRRFVEIAIDVHQSDLVFRVEKLALQGARQAIGIEAFGRMDAVGIDPVLVGQLAKPLDGGGQGAALPDLDVVVGAMVGKPLEAVEGEEFHVVHAVPPGLGQRHAKCPNAVAAELVIVADDAVVLDEIEATDKEAMLLDLPIALIVGNLILMRPILEIPPGREIDPWLIHGPPRIERQFLGAVIAHRLTMTPSCRVWPVS
jgi:hypothetical protein